MRQHTFAAGREDCLWPSVDTNEEHLAYVLLHRARGGYRSHSDIYTKPMNGKVRTQKTFHEGIDAFPSYSRDGSKIAFASQRTGNYDIYITNANSGRAKRQVTSSSAVEVSPSWSADGTKLAFSRYSGTSSGWQIWIYDLNTGSLTNLVPGLFPRFHPKENTLLFQRVSAGSTRYGIWTIDEQGTQEIEIISSQKTSYINPDWSPDGERIVFASGQKVTRSTYGGRRSGESTVNAVLKGRANDIWTIRRDGTQLNQLTTNESEDWGPCWGASGRIYFASDRDGHDNIWSVMPEFIEFPADALSEDAEAEVPSNEETGLEDQE